MTPQEIEEAARQLAARPEYEWLTREGAPSWYRITDVAEGAGVTRNTVRAWCEAGRIPGAVNYGPDLGWRMPRSGLLEYFAGLQRGGTTRAG